MYNAHWIHSLPYSKFIELTFFYGMIHLDSVVFLMTDGNGTEYLIYTDGSFGAGGRYNEQVSYGKYITEKYFNYLKEHYVNQDFAELGSDGQAVGSILRCEDLVIKDGNLVAKCRAHKTNETIYKILRPYGVTKSGEKEELWELQDEYVIVVL